MLDILHALLPAILSNVLALMLDAVSMMLAAVILRMILVAAPNFSAMSALPDSLRKT
jgi:hypothetical protein